MPYFTEKMQKQTYIIPLLPLLLLEIKLTISNNQKHIEIQHNVHPTRLVAKIISVVGIYIQSGENKVCCCNGG